MAEVELPNPEELEEIETEAKKLEHERDLYRSKLPYFESQLWRVTLQKTRQRDGD
jgi:hypothetical protein